MENLYEILNSHPNASLEELRKSYTALARKHHPDKHSSLKNSDLNSKLSKNGDNDANSNNIPNGDHSMFVKIDKAWKILSDPQLRAEFDAKWQERCLAQDLPIQDEVSFEEFDYDESSELYYYPCRCGSSHVLGKMEAEFHYDIVSCETCSLAVRVLYEPPVS